MYIGHNLRKIKHFIGDHTLGYIYPQEREFHLTTGLDEYGEKEVEAHEILHYIYKDLSEYLNRIKTWCVLRSLNVSSKYH